MQTFLPYSDYTLIAKCLDRKRLNKQILEADTLIDLIEGHKDNFWKNHPAYKMWKDYPHNLEFYRDTMLKEWVFDRKFNNTRDFYGVSEPESKPWFVYDEKVIISHRSNLVRKLPEHYGNFGWKDFGIEGYFWPCEVKTKRSILINEQWKKELSNGKN